MTRVLGIDPGSVRTGYGVIDTQARGSSLVYVASGCIRPREAGFPERLAEIYRGVCGLIEQYDPDAFAIEEVFLARNPQSALKLGQARGVAIAAAVAGNLSVAEYAAKRIKLSVVGTGKASKEQVQHMVAAILGLPSNRKLGSDSADALAIAICHVNTSAP